MPIDKIGKWCYHHPQFNGKESRTMKRFTMMTMMGMCMRMRMDVGFGMLSVTG